MNHPFEPRNELEQKLVDAQEGRIDGEEFLAELLAAQVFMPVLEKHRIGNFQSSQQATPVTLEDEEGQTVVVLFTSPERARPFVDDLPGYSGGGLLTEFTWVLEKIGVGVGVSLNPGWSAGLELAAEMVEALARGARDDEA